MSLKLNSSGGGSVTLQEPVTASNLTLTLPTSTTTVVGTDATQTLTNKTLSTGLVMGASAITSSTTQLSTSGTSIDFTGIPSWAKRITVLFNNVSRGNATTSSFLIQLIMGTSTVNQSGYSGSGGSGSSATLYTTGFGIRATSAADIISGSVQLCLCEPTINPNNWIAWGVLAGTATAVTYTTAGGISIGQPLTGVRVTTTTGTDPFDSGAISLFYE